MKSMGGALLALILLAGTAEAQTPSTPTLSRADQIEFRALYKELVEIDTTLSNGSCTRAAEAMAARLRAAGFPAADVRVIAPPDRPKDGNLVAVLRGSNRRLPALLLLAHIDVVEARREDWTRDPFSFIEEGGYFYARGVADDKAMAAVFTDSMVRFKRENYRPRRDIKMALTCGEETSDTHNGVEYLLEHHRPLIQAGFAINEGAGGRLDAQGNRVALGVQAGEKVYQDFIFETTNPGGHSSRPSKENAIYRLSAALLKVQAHDFPIELNDATRLFFTRNAAITGGDMGAAMRALVANPADARAVAMVTRDVSYNSMLRTTCVATTVDAGHAPNALPQKARANVNCRILPGHTPAEVKAELERVIADPRIAVSLLAEPDPVSPPPPLMSSILGPIEQVAAKLWPGVPVVPAMATGATDGRFLNHAGIPTYGVSGMFGDPDGGGAHGLNERIRVRSVYEGRDFLHDLVKVYASRR
ncbi:MAG: M20/M25/M40 family metallo-hydrolase [Alphaproteobacteria bacterium]|nr:M20/M25/M40 family metallo-hydrolase [Alphaproteobacteria bacterium]